MKPSSCLHVALPVPLPQLFDYLPPLQGPRPGAGVRVRVPFGRTRTIGVVTALLGHSEFPAEKLKPIEAVLDVEPLLQQYDIDFLTWVAGYYHHPPGEVIAAALPLRLRKAEQALKPGGPGWRLTAAGKAQIASPPARAPRQAELLSWLGQRPHGEAGSVELKSALPGSAATLRTLRAKGWIEARTLTAVADRVVLTKTDGDARGAAWLNAHHAATPVAHAAHRDRDASFFAARGNHYWFDLNRQWLAVTQPEAAAVVGRELAKLGERGHQVFCITHLPQVAARAGGHLRIEKIVDAGRAVTRVVPLADDDREIEVARMLSGDETGPSARAHARSLLGR